MNRLHPETDTGYIGTLTGAGQTYFVGDKVDSVDDIRLDTTLGE